MEWYSRKHFTTNETTNNHSNNNNNNNIRLRQTRLRWREFEAVLKVDRLELYLVTVSNNILLFYLFCLQRRQGTGQMLDCISVNII